MKRHRRALIGLLITMMLALVIGCGSSEPELIGTDLEQEPSPEFTLTDYRGQMVNLSDFRGKVVALTFIYTRCPDVCPLTVQKLRQAYSELSADVQEKVALLAITVDPDVDTAPVLAEFSTRHQMDSIPNWHAFPGERSILDPIWTAYHINPGAMVQRHEEHGEQNGTHAEHGSDQNSQHAGHGTGHETATLAPEPVGHTDAIFLIDPNGRQRVLMRSDLDPTDLTRNLDTLAS